MISRARLFSGRVLCAALLFAAANFTSAATTVKFLSVSCPSAGGSPGTINSNLIARRAVSNTTFVFPAGKFRLDPITLKGLSAFSIVGNQPSGPLSRGTRFVFSGGSGITFLDGGVVSLNGLEIEAPANSSAVKIAGSGNLQTPSLLVTSAASATTESCLSTAGGALPGIINTLLN